MFREGTLKLMSLMFWLVTEFWHILMSIDFDIGDDT